MKVNKGIFSTYSYDVSDWEINSFDPLNNTPINDIENCYVAGMVPYNVPKSADEYMYLYPDYRNYALGLPVNIKTKTIKCKDISAPNPRAQLVFSGWEGVKLPSPDANNVFNICKQDIKFAKAYSKAEGNFPQYDTSNFIEHDRFYCNDNIKQTLYQCNQSDWHNDAQIIVNDPNKYYNKASFEAMKGDSGETLDSLMNNTKCFSDCTPVEEFFSTNEAAWIQINNSTKESNTRYYCTHPEKSRGSRCKQYLVSSKGFTASKDVTDDDNPGNTRVYSENAKFSNIKSCATADSFDPRGFKEKRDCEKSCKVGPTSDSTCVHPVTIAAPISGADYGNPEWNINSYPISVKGPETWEGNAPAGSSYQEFGKNQKWGCQRPNDSQTDSTPGNCALYIEHKNIQIDQDPCAGGNCYTGKQSDAPGQQAPALGGGGRKAAAQDKKMCIDNCYKARGIGNLITCGDSTIKPGQTGNGDTGYLDDLVGGGDTANLYPGMFAGCRFGQQNAVDDGCQWILGSKMRVNCMTGHNKKYPQQPSGGWNACVPNPPPPSADLLKKK